MRRHFLKSALAMVVVAGTAILGTASPAGAVTVTYSTVGTFTGGDAPGTNVYLDATNGIEITFDGIVSQFVNAPSQAQFGIFDTTGTTAASLESVSSGFTLDIFQTTPEVGGPLTFIGTLQGTLSADASGAFVLFEGPLSQSLSGLFTTTYTIIEADENTIGRANLNPPSTAEGRSSVEGVITATAVPIPEPSTMLMGAMAIPAMLLCLRRKGKVTV